MDLEQKTAVVTGASEGLGAVMSRALCESGATVFGLARTQSKLDALRDEIGEAFVPVACDVRDRSSVDAAFDRILGESDRLDVLVNNAGLGRFGPVAADADDALAPDDWDLQVETNLRGVFLCTRRALPRMKEQNEASGFGGHVVNIASVAGLLGNPNLSAYNATKFGLRGFSEALMKEVRDDGIRVTCLFPGSIATEFASSAGTSGSKNPMQPEDIAGTLLHVLRAPDNYLISEITMRPLRPRG
jgi:NAD(P)-dependent dehydrogenase (short-subunit alcohol dehydrogenase family)